MPLGNASENPSRERRPTRLPGAGSSVTWALRLVRIGESQFFLSCTVLVAAAVLVTVVAIMSGRQGNNADLPIVALIASGIWIGGWLIQVAVHLGVARLCGLQSHEIIINLVGIETRPRRWPATKSLFVSLWPLVALIFCGVFFWWADGGFQKPILRSSETPFWSPPGIGLATSDSTWRVAAWLFWVQGVCQMFPLPRTLGRQILGALTVISSPRLDARHQVIVFRRCLLAMAFVTLVIAILMISAEPGMTMPKWPLIMLLALLVGMSSRAGDLRDTIHGLRCSSEPGLGDRSILVGDPVAGERGDDQKPTGVIDRVRHAVRARKDVKRIKRAMAMERREAVDADRLDEILNRLHEHGPDSISLEDRAILDRVSQALQKRRAEENDPT